MRIKSIDSQSEKVRIIEEQITDLCKRQPSVNSDPSITDIKSFAFLWKDISGKIKNLEKRIDSFIETKTQQQGNKQTDKSEVGPPSNQPEAPTEVSKSFITFL